MTIDFAFSEAETPITDHPTALSGDESRPRTIGPVATRKLRPSSWAVTTVAATTLSAGAWVAINRPGPWLTLAVVIFTAAVLWYSSMAIRQIAVSSLSVGSFVATVDYVSWRSEVVNWHSWWVAVPLFAAELFGAVHSLGIFYTVWPTREAAFSRTRDATLQPVFVVIPTVDEGVEIVGATIRASVTARDAYLDRYPQGQVTIVVCNDGRVAGYAHWADIDALAFQLGAVPITRTVGGGAKAGNVEHARDALGIHGDALMVVFDADQIAEENFLIETIPILGDESVAWVQTGQYYSNIENPVTKWAEDQQAIFYKILCPGKSASNSAFICGTNVVIRAAALDEIGGFPQDSVTEDFAASLKLHARWRSVFVPGVLARGLGPLDLPSYLKQQNRWAIGTLGVMRSSFWSLLSRRSGLTAGQSIQYMLACTHYLSGLKDFIFLASPIVFLLFGFAAVSGATLHDFLLHFVPFFVVSQIAFWMIAGRHTSMRGIFIAFASSPTLVGSLITVVIGRKVGFKVTSKSRSGQRNWSHLIPFIGGLGAGLAAIVAGFIRDLGPAGTVSILWVGYSMVILSSILHLGVRDIQGVEIRRRRTRHRRPRRWRRQLLVTSAGLVAIVIVTVVAMNPNTRPPSAAAAPLSNTSGLTWGMMLAGDQTRPANPELRSAPLGLVGRSQLISDSFDERWAGRLARRGATPWVTLTFGSNQDDVDSGLLSIRNGRFDAQLTRWARAIRAHEGPVLLTVLPQVDGDWSVSSAVARGGIPADSSAAWNHIRYLFRTSGAANASFAWAPAVPWRDRAFAPSPSHVDAVVVSEIHRPGSPWYNINDDIAATAKAHPGKPLIVLIGAADGGTERASWLRSSLRYSAENRAVRAVAFQEAPAAVQSATAAGTWSLASDEASLAVFHTISRTVTGAGSVDRSELETLLEASN